MGQSDPRLLARTVWDSTDRGILAFLFSLRTTRSSDSVSNGPSSTAAASSRISTSPSSADRSTPCPWTSGTRTETARLRWTWLRTMTVPSDLSRPRTTGSSSTLPSSRTRTRRSVSIGTVLFSPMLSQSFLTRCTPLVYARQNGSEEYGEELDAAISKIDAEIVRMAPNMKAADKYVPISPQPVFSTNETDRGCTYLSLSGWVESRPS